MIPKSCNYCVAALVPVCVKVWSTLPPRMMNEADLSFLHLDIYNILVQIVESRRATLFSAIVGRNQGQQEIHLLFFNSF